MGYALTIEQIYCFAKRCFRIASKCDVFLCKGTCIRLGGEYLCQEVLSVIAPALSSEAGKPFANMAQDETRAALQQGRACPLEHHGAYADVSVEPP